MECGTCLFNLAMETANIFLILYVLHIGNVEACILLTNGILLKFQLHIKNENFVNSICTHTRQMIKSLII